MNEQENADNENADFLKHAATIVEQATAAGET